MPQPVVQTVKFHTSLRDVIVQPRRAEPRQEPNPVADKAPAPAETPAATAACHVLLEQISEQLQTINDARAQNLEELQEVAIELGVTIAAHLLRKDLEAGAFDLNRLIQEAISQLDVEGGIAVHLHPNDLEMLTETTDPNSENPTIDFHADPQLPRGACSVVGGGKGLLSSFESRLENIRDTLLQGIEYARIERRKSVGADEGLRRFPDRRQLA